MASELSEAQIWSNRLCMIFWDGSETLACQISASETGAMFWTLSYRFEVLIRRASVWDPSQKIKHNLLDPIWASESSEAIQTLRSDQASTLHPMNKEEFCRNCVSVWIALCEWLSELYYAWHSRALLATLLWIPHIHSQHYFLGRTLRCLAEIHIHTFGSGAPALQKCDVNFPKSGTAKKWKCQHR